MLNLILLAVSYLVGSIPFGFLIVYWRKNLDIRTVGSGNIGATNVTRILGKPWGILVFILDFFKGLAATLLVLFFAKSPSPLLFILAGVASVCGHNWTPFLKFKGGKGVSTSLGVIAGLSFSFPNLIWPFLICLAIWALVFFMFKIVSLASIASAVSFLLACLVFSLPVEFKALSFIFLIFGLIRHKKNIKKLLEKKEARF